MFKPLDNCTHLPCYCFLHSSAGKESTCSAGDHGLIPGSGRSAGEGIDYPLQCSWASLVAKLVNNPSAMQETWVQSLGWEDLLEKGKFTHSSILAWRISWTIQPMGLQRVGHDWTTFIHSPTPMLLRLCSTSSKLGFHIMRTENTQMFKQGLEKAEEPKVKLPTFTGS